MKKFTLHFNAENKPFRPAIIVRWLTIEAKSKKEAKKILLDRYFNCQSTSIPPKGYTID